MSILSVHSGGRFCLRSLVPFGIALIMSLYGVQSLMAGGVDSAGEGVRTGIEIRSDWQGEGMSLQAGNGESGYVGQAEEVHDGIGMQKDVMYQPLPGGVSSPKTAMVGGLMLPMLWILRRRED